MTHAPATLVDRQGEDLSALSISGDLYVVWASARLDRESLWAAVWRGGEWTAPHQLAADQGDLFRPAVTEAAGSALAVACGPRGIVGVALDRNAEPRAEWEIPVGRGVTAVALAPAGEDRAWLAYEQRRGAESRTAVGRVTAAGDFEPVSAPVDPGCCREAPALAVVGRDVWMAWVEGGPRSSGTVHLAPVTDAGLGEPIVARDGDGPHTAPVLAASGDRLYAAWHAPVPTHPDSDVLRWLRVVEIDPYTRVVRSLHPHADVLSREAAGFDQAWEFPALLAEPDALWLGGRSSHGFHVARRGADGWSRRTSLSSDEWGGRGRRTSLVRHGDLVLYVRREPDGIESTPIAVAGEGESTRDYVATPAVRARPARRRGVLFGDLHQHTALSDGCGMPEELYLAGRDERGLDFAAVTDHDRFCRRAIGPATWSYLRHVADAFHEPGRFVTFPAYEFTGPRLPGPGHKCVYFADDAPARVPDKEVDAVFDAVRMHGGLAVPHHVGWTGADIEHHDPIVQPVWEIVSVHGCYECHGGHSRLPPRDDVVLPDQFVANALDAGLRFGFIGSTDSHGLLWHHGVAHKRNPFSCGLAAVLTSELERGAIMGALRQRLAYATSGARIYLRVDLDGAPMGAEVPLDTRGTLGYEVEGTAAIDRIVLVSATGERELDGVDGARASGSVPVQAGAGRPHDYAYLRVLQREGEMAWSSPIFFC